jgi:signal transduction histidine kinase
MDLAWLGSSMPPADLSLAGKVQRMRNLVDRTIDSVHRISTELRPILLDDLGLAAAMEWQVGNSREGPVSSATPVSTARTAPSTKTGPPPSFAYSRKH